LEKILIIDDEPDIIEFLSYNLRKEGFEVFSAMNGLEGLETARKVHPDLVLLDIMMPEMDGIEVCRQLRSEESLKHVLVAYLTAREEDFTQIAALDVGGDDFISKPIKPRIIISRIKALLRRKQQTNTIEVDDSLLIFGDLIIDRTKYEVRILDETIDLARKEFEILHFLANKPGKVFSRDEIFDKIWGSDVIVGMRTIDVHIRKLREKIGENHIKTIKGVGYKFDF
jgi:two-component system alkaline phosphatase synthesis response regulator PhoP